jgi:3-methyl-2-oxobutanoate hydroxymethyltransferase
MPKFVRKYADIHGVISGAVEAYAADVREGRFPDDATSYHLKPEVAAAIAPKRSPSPKRKATI